jgi:hypothetical protein
VLALVLVLRLAAGQQIVFPSIDVTTCSVTSPSSSTYYPPTAISLPVHIHDSVPQL